VYFSVHFTSQLTDFCATLYSECVKYRYTAFIRGGGGRGEVPCMVGFMMPTASRTFPTLYPSPHVSGLCQSAQTLVTSEV